MARYFFHLHEDSVFRDEEGGEFHDEDSARENAVRSAREMACAQIMEGLLVLSHSIEIVDDQGRQVGEVSYADAAGLSECAGNAQQPQD